MRLQARVLFVSATFGALVGVIGLMGGVDVNTNAAILRTALSAFERQDIEGFVGFCAQDVLVTEDGFEAEGQEAVRQYLLSILRVDRRRLISFTQIAESSIGGETRIIVEETYNGQSPDRIQNTSRRTIEYGLSGALIRRITLPSSSNRSIISISVPSSD